MHHIKHTFERQASRQTLGEGLAEYHEKNPGLRKDHELSIDAREFFRCHDVVHVVYGCSTSMPDEAVVKLASLFGTTAGFQVLKGYRLNESLCPCGNPV